MFTITRNVLNFISCLGCLLVLVPVVTAEFYNDFYKYSARDSNGTIRRLWDYRRRPSLVVNVASECGFTENHYTSLMDLSQSRLGERLNIFLFPCNQFGNQEPGSIEVIKDFVKSNYPGNYLLFDKVDVVGDDADPIYDFLADSADKDPTWNFWKYLVAPDGSVIGGWGPWVTIEDIHQYLVAATQMSSRDEL